MTKKNTSRGAATTRTKGVKKKLTGKRSQSLFMPETVVRKMQAEDKAAGRKRKSQKVDSYFRIPGAYHSKWFRFWECFGGGETLVRHIRANGVDRQQRAAVEDLIEGLRDAMSRPRKK